MRPYSIFIFSILIIGILASCKDDNTPPDPFAPVTDIDGNVYTVVKLGNQYWMKENLRVTRYRDGYLLPNRPNAWFPNVQYQGAYDDYNGDSLLLAQYGRLYNWYAVTNPRGLCPKGWRMPTEADWEELIDFLGGYNVAGGKLKDTSMLWEEPNIAANNFLGFSALPGGYRRYGTPLYFRMGQEAHFWSASETENNWEARFYLIPYKSAAIERRGELEHKGAGRSCRCIKESEEE